MTLGQKIDYLEKLDPIIHPSVLGRIHQRLARDRATSQERNRYIHDMWVFDPSTMANGSIRRLSAKFPDGNAPAIDFQETMHTMPELQTFSLTVLEASEFYMGLAKELGSP